MSSPPPIKTLEDAERHLECPRCRGRITAKKLEAVGTYYLICENTRCMQTAATGASLKEALAKFEESVDGGRTRGVE